MGFEDQVKEYISNYVEGHIITKSDIEKTFNYILDEELRQRITKEFYIARYIYKFFQGMSAVDELLEAQVRLQVIMYANIYEAVLHYILFELYGDEQIVIDLKNITAPIEIYIPEHKKDKISKALVHEEKEIKTYYIGNKKRELTKIRFDEKADAAYQLGLLDEELKNEVITIYNLRNGIHLHAEIRKQISWDLDMSKKAYWRIEKLNQLVSAKLIADNKVAG